MKLLKTYPSTYYTLYTIFLLFLSHTVFYLKSLNIFLTFLLILFVLINLFFREIPFPKFTFQLKVKDLKLSHLIITLLIIFPSIFFLYNISFGDFNWGGDHRDFVLASLVNNEFWFSSITSERNNVENFRIENIFFSFFKLRIFLLVILISLTVFLYKKEYGNLSNVLLLIIFYFWSSIDIINFEKDPRGSFFISLPFNSLFYFLKLNLMDAIRFTNFFSIIFWLLILRPIIIGEYPNLKILPFALAIYWNPQMIYIVNGGFTEPWSIIFLLLAIELVIKKKYNWTPHAIVLLAIGACFKSPISFLIPCFFLYGKPWIADKKRRLIHCLTLFSSILPIYLFTKLRDSSSEGWQPIKFQNYGFSHLDSDYLNLAHIYLENYKYILIVCLICFFIFFKDFLKNRWENTFFLSTSIFLFSIYFFNNLTQMQQHVMYFRYFMWSYLMLFGFLLINSINIKKRKHLLLIVFIIIFNYSFELIKFLKINKNNLYELNFISFDTDPIFLGLDPLIKENKEILDKKKINEVYISRSTRIIYRIPQYLYKDIKISTTNRSEIICECSKEKPAIINFFPKLRRLILNFKEDMTAWPEGYNELYGHSLEKSQNECLKKMNNTCSIVKLLKENDGKIISTLGIH
jgi:hypothetical protein